MTFNAPGQLMGYTVQFPRALVHLLRSYSGDAVGIEVWGDVATLTSQDALIAEEDKTSTNSNPLTDRSVDLWKTLHNWLKLISTGTIDVNKTRFLVYTNKTGWRSLVNLFHEASTIELATTALNQAQITLSDIAESHEIWRYYKYVMDFDRVIVHQLLMRFELEISENFSFDEIKRELTRMLIGENQIGFATKYLNGWILESVIDKISNKEPAIIFRDEFNKQFMVIFDRARRLELIDFALKDPPSSDTIQSQVKIQPSYVQRLIDIEVKEDELIEAVTEYIRAKVNREKWIEDEFIDEETAQDFESRLISFWRNKRQLIEITNHQNGECERGRLLLGECKIRQENIRDMAPPSGTVAGTYHTLVDNEILAWHPKWKKV